MITNYSKNVRVVSSGDPFTVPYDLIIETLIDGEWKYFRGFNTFSNDYAYSSAREAATKAVELFKYLEAV